MSLESSFGSAGKQTKVPVRRAFWGLLIGLSLLTLLLSGIAIWRTARPILDNFQYSNLELSAKYQAQELRAKLEQDQRVLEFLAAQSDVISLTLGNIEQAGVLQRYSFEARLTSLVRTIALFDAYGEVLDSRRVGNSAAPAEIWELSKQAENTAQIANPTLRLLTSRSGNIPDSYTIATCVPVFNEGFSEGALCAIQRLHLTTFDVAAGLGQASSLVDQRYDEARQQANDLAIPLGIGDFQLIVAPHTELADQISRAMLIRILVAITAVLALTKGIFAIYGHSVIVKPHLKLVKQQRELSELAAIAMRANDAFLLTDLQERIVWCNPAFELLTGYSLDEMKGRNPADFLNGPETDEEVIEQIKSAIINKTGEKIETINYAKSGRKYWASVSITPLFDPRGTAYGYMSITTDITSRRRQTEALIASQAETEHMAEHDALTGLPNRRFLEKELQRRAQDHDSPSALIHIDLDGFKTVNDTLGHEAGDHVLKTVGQILSTETRSPRTDRPGDVAVRLGGDEFLILAAGTRQRQDALALCKRIKSRLEEPIYHRHRRIDISASFGIALPEVVGGNQDNLIHAADAATYEAKAHGRGAIYIYDEKLDQKVRRKRLLAEAIGPALRAGEFVPYFQLQFDARSRQIVGAEVLARWQSPKLGLISPYEFLPIIEELSLIGELDEAVFQSAIDRLPELTFEGRPFPRLSFNVTGDRLLSGQIFEFFKRQPESGTRFSIEVLESITVESRADEFRREIQKLREIGLGIEVDDFGSGHASVSGVVALQPDIIKIDRSLVAGIHGDSQARKIFAQLIKMGRLMGVGVTAEGVETETHAKIATELGCDRLQGFGLAVPLPVGELKARLNGLISPEPA